ncbi:MAG: cytochrome c oxidase assembly protein [Chloroflexi bacterium]|nr:cytochrome c oxidase assembly protein [Chloroflexota bacterium]
MNWTVLIGLLVMQTGYLLAVGPWRDRFRAANDGRVPPPLRRARQITFMAGVLTLALALSSPIDELVSLLQSMHMVQHILLTLIAPPLLLLGTPGWLLRPALAWPGVGWLAFRLTRPKVAFAVANVTFLVWHFPVFYDLALLVEPVHILEHLTMLATGMLMWWPIVGVLPELPRLSPPLQMLYVFLLTLPSALLGIILGMARAPLYPSYTSVPRLWGLSPLADQQISGLIMWVGSNMFWLGVLTAIFFVWNAREEAEEQALAQARGGNGLAGSRP